VTKPNFCLLNSNLLSILPYRLRVLYNANVIYLNDTGIQLIYVTKRTVKFTKQLQNPDKISVILVQVEEYYINCVRLRNIVTYLKNVIALFPLPLRCK
jgi:hypothetical protein